MNSARQHLLLPMLFTVTVFANAALMFSVEPMFAKLALPLLGGTPNVWNTALVFFQAVLLFGYAYANLTTTYLPPRSQSRLHVAVVLVSWLALPLQLRLWGDPPSSNTAVFWLLGMMAVSVGPLFFVLSTGAPLLQRWFSLTRHPSASNPYFLYAASNVGSLAALLSYPMLIEPALGLATQRASWSILYVIVSATVAICGVFATRGVSTVRSATRASVGVEIEVSTAQAPRARDRMRWVGYSAVASSLLMGATTFVSSDVAALPLLWVVPLALYLLTFTIVFARTPVVKHAWMLRIEPYFLILAAVMFLWGETLPDLYGITFHFSMLFVIAMVCHGELSRMRPAAGQLTEFFLWISIGGLAGGIFNSLVAPFAFNDVLEYPLAIAAAAFLRPMRDTARQEKETTRLQSGMDFFVPALILVSVLIVRSSLTSSDAEVVSLKSAAFMAVLAVVLLHSAARPMRFALSIGIVLLLPRVVAQTHGDGKTLLVRRSYFGVYRVRALQGDSLVELIHGTTVHGAQRRELARRGEPLSYYARSGPVGDVFNFSPAGQLAKRRVGIVGLGAGSMACYSRPGDVFTYFEIDPLIDLIARDARYFSFLGRCAPTTKTIVGDARLTLQNVSDASFDILVLDAFSSDAIPTHLMTREAFALYDRLLARGGIVAIHISNKHLDLEPVVATVADASGFQALTRGDFELSPDQVTSGQTPTVWVVLARTNAEFGSLVRLPAWTALRYGGDLWRDDFSNVMRAIKW